MKRRFFTSLTMKVLIANLAAIVAGALVTGSVYNFKLAGDLFLRIFQICIVLYVMSVVSGAVLLGDTQDVGKMAIHTFKWILSFTLISAMIGAGLSIILKPGIHIQKTSEVIAKAVTEEPSQISISSGFLMKIINLFTEGSLVSFIILAIFFGIAMGAYAKESRNQIIVQGIIRTDERVKHLMKIALFFVPFGIFCLVVNVVHNISPGLIGLLYRFLLVLLLGDILQGLIFIPLTCKLTKVSVGNVLKKLCTLSALSLLTTSGAICLPAKMTEEVEKFGISKKVADFTGPITMAMNSCGAVQCYVAAIFFLAQYAGVELSLYQIILAIFLSILMCMGTISVPGGSVVVYGFLAASLGLPTEGVALLISVDWIAGMLRTLMNVNVDVLVGMLVAEKLEELDHEVMEEKKIVSYL